VTAYLLNLNGILPDDGMLDRETLPKIMMPNRNGFIPDAVFNLYNERPATSRKPRAR
jgi:cytochrome c